MLLKTMGQRVRTALSGEAALQIAREERPDVVISDIGMPDMNGYELAQWFRKDAALQGVALVALTGYGQDSDRERALEAGFNHHLVKPVSFKALQQLLASLPAASEPVHSFDQAPSEPV
jgi:CheY-like chemotaxis protein